MSVLPPFPLLALTWPAYSSEQLQERFTSGLPDGQIHERFSSVDGCGQACLASSHHTTLLSAGLAHFTPLLCKVTVFQASACTLSPQRRFLCLQGCTFIPPPASSLLGKVLSSISRTGSSLGQERLTVTFWWMIDILGTCP